MISPLASPISRRAAVGRIGVGGAAALVAARAVGSALAQDASPVASPAALPPLLQSWIDAWNTSDAKAIAALYTPDGVYEDVASATMSTGGDVAGYLGAFIASVGNIQVTAQTGFATPDWAALEWTFAATNNGFVPGAAAQGKSFSVRVATIFALSGDKIRRSADYLDAATILGQLGLMPAPGATPTA
ncbi:MAG TPA: ester cyclase [Thermomicrobiales bacterium]|jgi:steroid delta-isomerase-like uncharacterized protein|nr:ester cyclase [Thermomicrobiales bacterium]